MVWYIFRKYESDPLVYFANSILPWAQNVGSGFERSGKKS